MRVVPIFPEIRPYLDACYFAAAEGAEKVIVRYRDKNSNLRTQLERIIGQAGLKPWPKLFQNLRASRATELAKQYPSHVAAEWLGHSREIAAEHYWRVTDEDYARAIQGDAGGDALGDSVHVTQSTTTNDKRDDFPEVCRAESSPVACGVSVQVTPRGSEHPPKTPRNTRFDAKSGTESGTVGAGNGQQPDNLADSALRIVIEAWPILPAETRIKIVRLATADPARLVKDAADALARFVLGDVSQDRENCPPKRRRLKPSKTKGTQPCP